MESGRDHMQCWSHVHSNFMVNLLWLIDHTPANEGVWKDQPHSSVHWIMVKMSNYTLCKVLFASK